MSPGALRREIALGAALALLVSLGWWFYRTQETSFRNQVEAELVAVGHLKVDQLTDWRRERLGDGAALASNPFFRAALPDWIRRPSSPSGELLRSLETLRRHYRYEDILLTDPGGRVLWSFGASRKVLAPAAREVLASALQARAPRLTDLHDPDSPHLGVVVPFFSSSGTPAGALVLVQDARKTLYPLLQSWPLPSDTAETLLVRREGNQVLFLNDLRHARNSALRLRTPLSRDDLPAAQAIRGTRGLLQGRDYRGEEVLASVLPVPGSPWFLVAKMDLREALGAWHRQARMILLLLAGAALALLGAGLLLWRQDLRRQGRLLARAEREREESAERYRTLFEDHHAVMWVLDPTDGSIVDANPAAAAFYGYPREELVRMKVAQINTDPPETLREALNQALGGMTRPFQFRHRLADGRIRDVEVYSGPIRWGERTLLFSVIHDVTESRRLQAERREMEARLLHAEKMESVGRLAGGVAHEFNNLLQVVLGHCDLLLEDAGEGATRDSLREIREAASQSAALVQQLLAFARRQTAAPRRLDLNRALAERIPLLRSLLGEGTTLLWEPGEGLWPLRLDPTQLERILVNLTSNARDALGGAGHFRIRTENATLDEEACRCLEGCLPGDYVLLLLEDDGVGMPPQVRERAFEPFFTSKGLGGGRGAGLGLATVLGMVEQNGGGILLDSCPGEGTRFRIYLPRDEEAPGPSSLGEDAEAPSVLLAEDEPSLLSLARQGLERLGYRVLAAPGAEEALSLAEAHRGPLHLLVADAAMRGMRGSELAKRVGSLHPETRVLYLSGQAPDLLIPRGILPEGAPFLPKPFSLKDLAAKVREVLGADLPPSGS